MLAAVEALLAQHRDALGLRLVDGALSFAALENNPPAASLPAAFVVPISDTASPNTLASGDVRQRVTSRFAVLICVARAGDARGGRSAAALDAIQVGVRDLLLGWRPAAGWSPVTYVGASLAGTHGGAVWIQVTFQAAHTIRRIA